MLTNNFIGLLKNTPYKQQYYTCTLYDGTTMGMMLGTTQQATNINTTTSSSSTYANNNALNYTGCYKIVVGSGSTAPTRNDYCMANIINDASFSEQQIFCTLGGSNISDDLMCTLNHTYRNNTNSNIIINEIGIIGGYQMTNPTAYLNKPLLIARRVLDTPIVLAPNEKCTITEDIRWSSINV